MKKKSVLITVVNIALLTASVGLYVSADSTGAYKSQGSIVFENNTVGTTDDVVFDASDFDTIDTIITDGKGRLATSLNAYPNTSVASLDSFSNLSNAIDTITDVPSVYYYDKTTTGDGCERYILEGGSYYPCDMYGVKTSDTALADTVVVVDKSDTSSPAAGEKHLVQYVGTDEASLSAGYAGYADKTFVLGSGADNIEYRDQGYSDGYDSHPGVVLNDTVSGSIRLYPEEDDSGESSFTLPVQGYNKITVSCSNYASGTRRFIVSCKAGSFTINNNTSQTINIANDVTISISSYSSELTAGSYTLSK